MTTLDLRRPPTDTAREARDRSAANRVLNLAADGLKAIADNLDDAFIAALDLFESVQGRVVITGMGKSGLIGRKIAATLASTGTPSFFVHPAEASHGDLGMITEKDAVLALSNSGETAELADILAYTRRFRIPLVGITRDATSSLGEASDIVLVLPRVAEACPNGLAPTTSTTMMLAYADAIAVALLERRNFTAKDFKVFHPGGALGKRVQKVEDLMHTGERLPLCAEDVTVQEALFMMTKSRMGCVGIVDGAGKLAGIITDGDVRRNFGVDILGKRASSLMTPGPISIRPNALAAEAVGLMNEKAITVLFAVEDGKPVGILHIHDLLHAGVH
jgi:arabinose-5-phosphate isomerase